MIGRTYFHCLRRKYFQFSGRAPRAEFWNFFMFQFVAVHLALIISGAALSEDLRVAAAHEPALLSESAQLTLFIIFVATGLLALIGLIPGMAVTSRRLKDLNWRLTPLLAFAIIISAFGMTVITLAGLIAMMFPGTKGPNRYGPDPRGGTAAPEGAEVFA